MPMPKCDTCQVILLKAHGVIAATAAGRLWAVIVLACWLAAVDTYVICGKPAQGAAEDRCKHVLTQ